MTNGNKTYWCLGLASRWSVAGVLCAKNGFELVDRDEFKAVLAFLMTCAGVSMRHATAKVEAKLDAP